MNIGEYRGQNNIKLFYPPSKLPTRLKMLRSNEQDVVNWINNVIPVLEGTKPIQLLLKEDGENLVLDCLEKMKNSDF